MPSLRKIKVLFVKQKEIKYEKVRTYDEATNAAMKIFDFLKYETQEVFCVLHFDSALNVIGYHEAFRGAIDHCMIDNRVIFRAVLLSGAGSIILIHNHPSDESHPSEADRTITKVIKTAAECLNIKLLDHIIVARSNTCSFKENGLL